MKLTPKRGWELNGLRFVSPGAHGETETFHAADFPAYGALPELLAAAEKAREVLRHVSKNRRVLGPIATAAQSAAWQITMALRAAGGK